jgi:tRNA A-37 threonylcarbamoyl transferase component Bud32
MAEGTLEPGTRIDGRYRIVGLLGAGGMGVVYRARDERLGRHVALKTLPASRVGDERARARLVREAKSAAGIEHPGIAQVYDVGETEDGGAFLVMELVKGQTLRALMQSGAVDRDELLDTLRQVAAALDHAHAQGVVHRDIKPDNVMVRDDGRAALLDFGLAKDLGPAVADTMSSDRSAPDVITKEGALIGTLSYLAPEQARGKVGAASDQFALATTAYEALSGRLPWDGQNAAAVLAQILVDDPPAPSSFEGTLPAAVDRVFARALSKKPEDRFPDTSSFVRALSEAFDRSAREDAPTASDAGTLKKEREASPFAGRISMILGVVFILVALGMIASLAWPHDDVPVPPRLSLRATIGCPILRASGVPAPADWLGAMGADLACSRLTWHLGGDPARTRSPAELAGLPRVAGDDFPLDPYGEEGARDRTLAAARELDAWLEGDLRRADDGKFHAALTLRDARGVIARGRGEGRAIYVAIGEAIDAIAASDDVPAVERIDLALRPWVGVDRTADAILMDELGDAELTGIGVEDRCRRLIARGDAVLMLRGQIERVCVRWSVEEARALEPPPLDESSLASLALTAPEHVRELGPERVQSFIDRFAAAREAEELPYARAMIAKAEIDLYEQRGEMDRARDLLLTAAQDLPREWFLRVHLVRSMLGTAGAPSAVRALAAWQPGKPDAWRAVALPMMRDPDRSTPFLRRAYLSGGTLPVYGLYLGDALLRRGRREEVRAIAACYGTSGAATRLAGECLRARVEITERRFDRAYVRLRDALAAQESFGRLVDGDVDCLGWYLGLAEILGRSAEAADPIAQRFVLADPPRLVVDQPHYELPSILLCLRASEALASACTARLEALASEARAGRIDLAPAFLTGASHYARGEARAAIDAWRPLVGRRSGYLPSEAFAREGEHQLAAQVERDQLAGNDFAGATLAHAAQAERAARDGDHARARQLAEQVVRAWGLADAPVPAVERMRSLLAELPEP